MGGGTTFGSKDIIRRPQTSEVVPIPVFFRAMWGESDMRN